MLVNLVPADLQKMARITRRLTQVSVKGLPRQAESCGSLVKFVRFGQVCGLPPKEVETLSHQNRQIGGSFKDFVLRSFALERWGPA